MSTPWFYAPPSAWSGDDVELPSDESRHAAKVMRVAPPDVITVTDGEGRVARCAVISVEPLVRASVLEAETRRRFKPQIVIYQGAAKSGKLDGMVERLAELGIAEVWAFNSERAVARWDETKARKLGERWNAIARSAAKQSRSPFVMMSGAGLSWTELIRRVGKEPLALTLWEEASLPMRAALAEHADRVALIIGPEGGLTKAEAESLADVGAPLVSLGPRILRTENAGFVAASALLYRYGLIG